MQKRHERIAVNILYWNVYLKSESIPVPGGPKRRSPIDGARRPLKMSGLTRGKN